MPKKHKDRNAGTDVRLPHGYTFTVDLATANQLVAALRVFQGVRQSGGRFTERNGQTSYVDLMEHFEETPQFDNHSIDILVDAIYNGVFEETDS